ncbi:hypothetical protein UA01_01492 [Streptococcus parasanguinis]|nr:hypothetical protein UA01_01492 [Streptococcus parasanguinis]
MSRSDRYTKDFMPTKEAIQRTYADYTELKELLENSVFHESGYYSLNNGKWFNSAIPSFLNFKIQKPDDKILLSRIYCKLSILSKGSRSQQKMMILTHFGATIQIQYGDKIKFHLLVSFTRGI